MNIPGFTPLEGRKFTGVASLVVVDSIEVTVGPIEQRQLEELIRHITRDIQAQMIRSFRDPKHGRTYAYKGRGYTASAPGEPPAIRSGNLLSTTFRGIDLSDPLESRLTIDTGYETFLELGTSRMRARPFVIPAITEVLTKLEQSEVINDFTGFDEFDVAA